MSNVFVFDPEEFSKTPIAKGINRSRELSNPPLPPYTNDDWQWFFDQVEYLILDNSRLSCLSEKTRKKLFYLLVAHKAELQNRIDGGNSSLIGRISSASEGSVSISSEFPSAGGKISSWLNQTPYGVEYLAMIAPYTSALWFSGTTPMPVRRTRFPYVYPFLR